MQGSPGTTLQRKIHRMLWQHGPLQSRTQPFVSHQNNDTFSCHHLRREHTLHRPHSVSDSLLHGLPSYSDLCVHTISQTRGPAETTIPRQEPAQLRISAKRFPQRLDRTVKRIRFWSPVTCPKNDSQTNTDDTFGWKRKIWRSLVGPMARRKGSCQSFLYNRRSFVV